jgi:hypothetical protein
MRALTLLRFDEQIQVIEGIGKIIVFTSIWKYGSFPDLAHRN